jgi:mono/diheme cytochrome c family protein
MGKLQISVLTLSAIFLGAFSLTGCSWDKSQPNVELIQDMMESPAVKSQEYDAFFEDHAGGARVPPEHTVPVGFKAYRIGFNPEQAKADRNPLAGDTSDEVLLTGQKYFETNCLVCHGQEGHGDGPVGQKMPNKPPSLVSDKVKGWSDGQIYQVITMGQGTMGPYASHIPQNYRWQVVNYIRHLQRTDKKN